MTKWIAVVDDDIISLRIAGKTLSSNGFRVSAMRSGAFLLNFLEDHEPDLILLDVVMPGMDGFETIKRLREFEKEYDRDNVPVIFLTSDTDDEMKEKCLDAGAVSFIQKPYQPAFLAQQICNAIGGIL